MNPGDNIQPIAIPAAVKSAALAAAQAAVAEIETLTIAKARKIANVDCDGRPSIEYRIDMTFDASGKFAGVALVSERWDCGRSCLDYINFDPFDPEPSEQIEMARRLIVRHYASAIEELRYGGDKRPMIAATDEDLHALVKAGDDYFSAEDEHGNAIRMRGKFSRRELRIRKTESNHARLMRLAAMKAA